MTRRLRSLDAASEEFEAAVRWYEERRPGLGAEFYEAVLNTMTLIADQPEIGTVTGRSGSARRILAGRFPYQIVYHLTATDIIIVAVLKRRPDYWRDRH